MAYLISIVFLVTFSFTPKYSNGCTLLFGGGINSNGLIFSQMVMVENFSTTTRKMPLKSLKVLKTTCINCICWVSVQTIQQRGNKITLGIIKVPDTEGNVNYINFSANNLKIKSVYEHTRGPYY